MPTELTVLALAALLQAVQFALYSVTANRAVGPATAMGPRDQRVDLPPRVGRLQRALTNHFEGLILFTIAVTVVTQGGQATGFTAFCAWTYLVARVLYVPAYWLGLAPWRSVVWMIGFLATLAMLVAALV